MTSDEFLTLVRTERPTELAQRFLFAQEVAAFSEAAAYVSFQARVSAAVPDVEKVLLAGSGNWGFSLNPEKGFKAFHSGSDLDVAIISERQFTTLWEEMRRLHRRRYYLLPEPQRLSLRRNGENVYAGFVSPLWLPEERPTVRLTYKRIFNNLSDRSVGFRVIRAYFFKNRDEVVSYYERGFVKARRALR